MILGLEKITLNVTDSCNYNCSYCYQKNNRSDIGMSWETCKNALSFSLDNSVKNILIEFSGGEPLLNFNLIRKSVEYISDNCHRNNRRISYSIITNGSLITSDILEFFSEYRFEVQYSFDSILQNKQRNRHSFKRSVEILDMLLNKKNITLSVSPVFTSSSVDKIFQSMMFLKKRGVTDISLGLDQTKRWNIQSRKKLKNQLELLKDEEIKSYRRTGKIIFNIFSTEVKNGVSSCGAGNPQLSFSPSGDIYGCPSFAHLNWGNVEVEKAGDYYYGNINFSKEDKLKERFYHIIENYRKFRTDNFYTANSKCFLCPYVQECKICPAINNESSPRKRSLFFVPDYICETNKIIFNVNRSFRNHLKR